MVKRQATNYHNMHVVQIIRKDMLPENVKKFCKSLWEKMGNPFEKWAKTLNKNF